MPDGQELFELYVEKLNDEGVDFDTWENLEPADQRAWTALAEALEERSNGKEG